MFALNFFKKFAACFLCREIRRALKDLDALGNQPPPLHETLFCFIASLFALFNRGKPLRLDHFRTILGVGNDLGRPLLRGEHFLLDLELQRAALPARDKPAKHIAKQDAACARKRKQHQNNLQRHTPVSLIPNKGSTKANKVRVRSVNRIDRLSFQPYLNTSTDLTIDNIWRWITISMFFVLAKSIPIYLFLLLSVKHTYI